MKGEPSPKKPEIVLGTEKAPTNIIENTHGIAFISKKEENFNKRMTEIVKNTIFGKLSFPSSR